MSARTIPHLFQSRVKQYGDRVALREKKFGLWKDISWNGYDRNTRLVGQALWALGCREGDPVAIIGDNCPEWLYIDLGTQSIGGVSIGVYSTSPANQVEYILDHSGAKFLFVENEEQLDKALIIRDRIHSLKKVIYWDDKGLKEFRDPDVLYFEEFLKIGKEKMEIHPGLIDEKISTLRPEDVAIIVYTSGTTGPPKGVMLTHENLISASESLYQAHNVYDTDELLSYLPLCHIGERTWSVTHAINYGYTVSFAESAETVPQDLREIVPTIFFGVPRIWEKFYANVVLTMKDSTRFENIIYKMAIKVAAKAAHKELNQEPIPFFIKLIYKVFDVIVYRNTKRMFGLQKCHFPFSGAAPIAPDILFFFHGLGIRTIEIYGQTEATGPISIHQGNEVKLGTVGKPVPGVEVKIADDGEILVKGKNVCKGYYKDEELTANTIVDGWLHTGDMGELDEEGNLTITDRKKDIIITSGGKNITPQYIENQLKFSPYINDAIVIGDGRKYLTALIMIDEENVFKYAQDMKIPFTTYASLTRAQEVDKLIQEELDKVNKKLSAVENIKYFRLIDVQLTAEDDELTPTMKLKRKHVSERFKELIGSMYRS
ncbi:MAG: AMP-binding protein [Pseudomonadota bacterium]